MSHPLITRLTAEMNWPELDTAAALADFIGAPGWHVVFVPGDPVRNLETADVAVILPELKMAFQGRFDCAVVGESIEAALREGTGVLKTPSLIFFHDGALAAGIPKVRDWDEYMTRVTQILSMPPAAAA